MCRKSGCFGGSFCCSEVTSKGGDTKLSRRPLVMVALCWVMGSAAAAALNGYGLLLAGAAFILLLIVQLFLSSLAKPLALACLLAFSLAAGERVWADVRNYSELQNLFNIQEQAQDKAGHEGLNQAVAQPVKKNDIVLQVEASGTIASAIDIDGDRLQFHLAADHIHLAGETSPRAVKERLIVHVKLEKQEEQLLAAELGRGSQVQITGTIEQPAAASNFGGFDYRKYLSQLKIHGLLKAKGIQAVVAQETAKVSLPWLLGRMDHVRNSIAARIEAMYPPEQAGYMKGLTIGMREGLDPDVYRQFSQLGLTHILAISGLHVAVFLFVIGSILKLLRMTRERMLMLMMAAIPFYMLLSGGSPSVVRAGIMAILGLVAARVGKLKDGLHLLAAAALIMLIADPYLLQNVGFQLSFLVTAGLILGVPPFRRLLPQSKRMGGLWDTLAVTIVAQAVSLPLSLYYFNQFHLLSLLANFALVPFISFIILPLGGASVLLSFIWQPAGAILAEIARMGNRLTFDIVSRLSEIEWFRITFATPSLWWVVATYAMLAVAIAILKRCASQSVLAAVRDNTLTVQPQGEAADEYTRPLDGDVLDTTQPIRGNSTSLSDRLQSSGGVVNAVSTERNLIHRRHAAWSAMILLIVLPLLWAHWYPRQGSDAQVSFLDVGQGDAILIRTGSGKHVLIDGGGQMIYRKPGEEWRERRDPFEVGRKTVVPLLQRRGVQSIDLLVISHLDSDHIKGLRAVVDSIPIKRMLWNGTMKKSPDSEDLLVAAAKRGIPIYRAAAGQQWEMDKDTQLFVLGGADKALFSDEAVPVVKDQNDNSVIMILQLFGRSFLFAGDAEAKQERQLIASQMNTSQIGIDIMKISHHGSKTSTTAEWLTYWRPAAAVISAGRNNSYGHPHPTVMERLKQADIPVLRTDQNGEVQLKVTSDSRLFVRTMLLD